MSRWRGHGVRSMPAMRRVGLAACRLWCAARHDRRALTTTSTARPSRGPGALRGVRVLDLSRILGGPWCTQQLVDHGAQVIKIERPGHGDDTRSWGPPFTSGDTSAYFLSCNRGKHSVAVNIKTSEGRGIVLALAKQCHVLVENFLPGELDALGLGYRDVQSVAPHCHYASLTGYGGRGPDSGKTGYDVMLAGEAGLISVTGSTTEPAKPGVAVTDIVTGLFLSNAIMAALINDRSSDQPVVGQRIETSLFASQVAMLSSIGQAALIDPQYEPRRWGTGHPSIVPYQAFPCGDGRSIITGALNDGQYDALCHRVLVRPDLASDSRYSSNPRRVEHRVALLAELSSLFLTRSSTAWIDKLEWAGLPVSPINDVRTALNHRQSQALGMITSVEQSGETQPVPMIAPPVSMSATPPAIQGGAPLLGEHTTSILKALLGLDDSEIQRYHSAGIVECYQQQR